MYIKHNDIKYACKFAELPQGIRYSGLPSDFPAPVNGVIALFADDGFALRADSTADYLRQIWEGGALILTNTPEPPEPTEPEEPETDTEPTEREILYTLLGVTDHE